MLPNVVVRNTCVQQKPPDLSVGSVNETNQGMALDAMINAVTACLIVLADQTSA